MIKTVRLRSRQLTKINDTFDWQLIEIQLLKIAYNNQVIITK